jgi:hypothetical protein
MFYTTVALCVHFNIILPPVPMYVKQSLHCTHFSFSIGTAYFIHLIILLFITPNYVTSLYADATLTLWCWN